MHAFDQLRVQDADKRTFHSTAYHFPCSKNELYVHALVHRYRLSASKQTFNPSIDPSVLLLP